MPSWCVLAFAPAAATQARCALYPPWVRLGLPAGVSQTLPAAGFRLCGFRPSHLPVGWTITRKEVP